MLALVIGTIGIQLYEYGPGQGIMSSTLATPTVSQTAWYCTQPDHFIDPDETAWCHGSQPEDIKQNHRSWDWTCVRDNEKQSCHFVETGGFKTRGGTFFKK